jgi:hypothetical protein
LLGTRRHEFLKCLRIDWLGEVMFEARFERLLAAIQYPTVQRLADIQLPFPERSEQRKPLEPHIPRILWTMATASAGIGSRN